jgi:hypothetical protein
LVEHEDELHGAAVTADHLVLWLDTLDLDWCEGIVPSSLGIGLAAAATRGRMARTALSFQFFGSDGDFFLCATIQRDLF